MNKIELLPKTIVVNDIRYDIGMWVTAWDRLCIGYRDPFNRSCCDLCSVCVEPENEPTKIEDTIGCDINDGVGNARTIDDAIEMIKEYINSIL